MLRIKFPNGIVTAEQLRTIGRLSVRYGRGMGDITTRQNIQLHWLRIEDLPVVLDEPNAVRLSFTQACGDVWRNVVGCPLAGVDGHELIDSRPLIAELERTFVGDRRFSNLPRKFKVSVSGCLHRCAQHEINDIGLVAVEHDGVAGYDVWVGGGLGASARMGRRLDAFVLPQEAAEVCAAITKIFRDAGKRTKRTRARITFLVDEWGVERLRAEVERKLGRALPASVAPADPLDPHRDHLGIHPQVEAGRHYLGATTLRGRFSGEQMIAVADIATRFGSGELRCTNRHNVIVLGVADADVEEAAASLADIGLPTRASAFRRGIISCTGMEFCKLAIVETKDRARDLIEHLERRVGDVAGSLRINLNGCPNACAQYQAAGSGPTRASAAGWRRRPSRPTTPGTRSSAWCAPTQRSGLPTGRSPHGRASSPTGGWRPWPAWPSRPNRRRRPHKGPVEAAARRGYGGRPPSRHRRGRSDHRRLAAQERGKARAARVFAAGPQLGLQPSGARGADELVVAGLGDQLGLAHAGQILVNVRVGKHVPQDARGGRNLPRFAVAVPTAPIYHGPQQFAYPPGRSPASHPERRRDRPCEASATIPARERCQVRRDPRIPDDVNRPPASGPNVGDRP